MTIIKRTKPEIVEPEERRRRPRDFQGLKAQLEDPDAAARRWAARDLAQYTESAPALVDRLKQETDAAVREAILMSLTEIGNDVAVQGLIECLRSEDAALRNDAIEAMKNLPESVAPIMEDLLHDADSDVRIFAVNVLESLRHPDVEKWLIEVISKDPHINVCATAVDLLSEVGTEAALPALEALKTRFAGEPYIQFAADLAIRRISKG